MTTCLLPALILFSVHHQSIKLEVVKMQRIVVKV